MFKIQQIKADNDRKDVIIQELQAELQNTATDYRDEIAKYKQEVFILREKMRSKEEDSHHAISMLHCKNT